MIVKGFRDLKVWDKSHKLTLRVYEMTKSFPQEEKFALVNQLRRSVVSVGANIAEGYQKSRKDFLRFLSISMGSLEETKYYFILSRDLKYISSNHFKELFDLSEEIGRMIRGLQKKLV